jgi:hypothetical protein
MWYRMMEQHHGMTYIAMVLLVQRLVRNHPLGLKPTVFYLGYDFFTGG